MKRDPLRLLIVDDDPEDIELIEDLLEEIEIWSVSATGVSDFDDALQRIRAGDLDLCLVDYRLEARTGLDFLRSPEVRSSGVPTILMTGIGTPELDREAWEAGAADYLPKSTLTALTLERSLRYALERSRRWRIEARFEALAGAGREFLTVVDRNATLIYLSRSVRRVMGQDPEALVGTQAIEQVHPEDRDRVRQRLSRILEHPEEEVEFQYRARHADGSWRILDSLARNHLSDPALNGVVISSRDVTERVRREERIRYQAGLLDAVGQAVVALDPERRIRYLNRAAQELYGWDVDEALGQRIDEVAPLVEPPGAGPEAEAELRELIARGEGFVREMRVRRRDGTVLPVLVTTSPIRGSEGEHEGMVAVASDISQIRRTEFELGERVKELRTLNRVTELLNRRDRSLGEMLQEFVDALPAGWLAPERTEARLTLPEISVHTPGFRESPWMLSESILSGSEPIGRLEIAVDDPPPEAGPEGFLPEEEELLATLARTLGEVIERSRVSNRLARIIDTLEEAVFLVTGDGPERRIEMVNRAGVEMFEYSEEELLGSSPAPLYADEESFESFSQERQEALRTEGAFRRDITFRRGGGTTFPAALTVTLLDPEAGPAGGAVTVVRDITESVRARTELERSERRFRELAERIDSVFWISSPEKQEMLYISPAYRTIWGRDPDELYEDPSLWMDPIHPEDRDRVMRYIARQPHEPGEAEYRIVRPDGSIRWIHDRSFPVRDEAGRALRVLGIAEDITRRRVAEERLGLLSRELDEAIYVLDREGRVRFATPSIERVAGYRREEFEGTNPFELVVEEDRARVRETFERILGAPHGEAGRVEYRFRRKDDTVRHAEAIGRNLLDEPGIEGILVTTRDITERVELEARLRVSQRMESIGRLAGGIAHDFNNLLTVIRSQASLLHGDLPETSPLLEDVEVIQTASERAARLTSQLLAFSRDQILQPRVVALSAVVERMTEMFGRVIGESIDFRSDLPDDLPYVKLDPGQLEQVVLNLVINARDAMPEGGTLTVRSFETRIPTSEATPEEPAGPYTGLEISDSGAGMDEAKLSRIFEPFYTTKSETGGTGLGLAMAYGYVKQSGGIIRVESASGEGTTFTLLFPAVEEEPDVESVVVTKEETDQLQGTVLIVEDDPAVRRIAVRVLERAGLTVSTAPDGEEALELLGREGPFDLVLTDLGLPGMSGRALVEEMRRLHPDLPVVVMSGYATGSNGQDGALPANVAFIPKPFTPDDLAQGVREGLAAG